MQDAARLSEMFSHLHACANSLLAVPSEKAQSEDWGQAIVRLARLAIDLLVARFPSSSPIGMGGVNSGSAGAGHSGGAVSSGSGGGSGASSVGAGAGSSFSSASSSSASSHPPMSSSASASHGNANEKPGDSLAALYARGLAGSPSSVLSFADARVLLSLFRRLADLSGKPGVRDLRCALLLLFVERSRLAGSDHEDPIDVMREIIFSQKEHADLVLIASSFLIDNAQRYLRQPTHYYQ